MPGELDLKMMHDSESAIKRLSNQISKGWSNGLLDVL